MRRLLPALLGVAVLALVAPAGAAAAPWTCEASVVRGTLGPAPPVEPITANKGATECADADRRAARRRPGCPAAPAAASSFARTRADGAASNPAGQRVSAEGSLGELRIPLLPGLPGLPAPPTVPAVTRARLRHDRPQPGDPGARRADRRPGRTSARSTRASPASARAGGPSLSGTWSIAGLSVLGVPIGTDRTRVADAHDRLALDRPLEPRPDADRAARRRPVGVRRRAPARARRAAEHRRSPRRSRGCRSRRASRSAASNTLTQRALSISLSIAGQSVVNFVAGEATVGGDGRRLRRGDRHAGAALHDPAARADRRRAAQGPRAAARRGRPPARRQPRVDPLPGHRQARRAAARRQGRPVPGDREAAAGRRARHQPRALPGAHGQGALARAQARAAACGSPRSRPRAGAS